MKYYEIIADYRPFTEKSPHYYYIFNDNVNAMKCKKWFSTTYSWLKVYKIYELTEEQTIGCYWWQNALHIHL